MPRHLTPMKDEKRYFCQKKKEKKELVRGNNLLHFHRIQILFTMHALFDETPKLKVNS